MILGKLVTDHIELDRVHRSPRFKRPNSTQPCDELCRVHYFVLMEEILRNAATMGTIDFDGDQLSLLPP